MILNRLQILSEQLRVARNRAKRLEQRTDGWLIAQTSRRPSRKQSRNELNAIGRHFKHCLVDKMLQHVLTPNVKNESDSRPKCGDITEILLWPNTQINAAGLCRFFQFGNGGSKFAFIRHVLEPKGARVFREVDHHPPERSIRNLDRKSLSGFEG